jgi:hypothetical protein
MDRSVSAVLRSRPDDGSPSPVPPTPAGAFSSEWEASDTVRSGERTGHDSSKSRVYENLDQWPKHHALSRLAQD